MNLKVKSSTYYEGRFPYYGQPREIGYFSLDSERNYCDDKHQLKYLAMPQQLTNLSMDLNEGYSEAVRKDFGKTEKLDSFLKWILNHQEEIKRHFIHQTAPSK